MAQLPHTCIHNGEVGSPLGTWLQIDRHVSRWIYKGTLWHRCYRYRLGVEITWNKYQRIASCM